MIKRSKDFKKIKKWVKKNNYKVKFSNTDQIDYDSKTISLYNQKEEFLIYSFLHECGHLILVNGSKYKTKYKSILRAEIDARHYRSNLYKYKKLKEEMNAWESGYKLSKKLKLGINKDKYDVYASKNFLTYLTL